MRFSGPFSSLTDTHSRYLFHSLKGCVDIHNPPYWPGASKCDRYNRQTDMLVAREPGVGDFPARTVTILSLCMTLNIYTLVSLFPYVGLMVQDILGLETTNESGERRDAYLYYKYKYTSESIE